MKRPHRKGASAGSCHAAVLQTPAGKIRRSDFLPRRRKSSSAIAGKGRESVSEYSPACIDMRADEVLISARFGRARRPPTQTWRRRHRLRDKAARPRLAPARGKIRTSVGGSDDLGRPAGSPGVGKRRFPALVGSGGRSSCAECAETQGNRQRPGGRGLGPRRQYHHGGLRRLAQDRPWPAATRSPAAAHRAKPGRSWHRASSRRETDTHPNLSAQVGFRSLC